MAIMLTGTPQETRLDLLRRLLAQPDGPDLRSPSGKGRRHAVLHAGCTAKVAARILGLVDLDPPRAVVRADAAPGAHQADGRGTRPCVAA
jgi:hypothetical protein